MENILIKSDYILYQEKFSTNIFLSYPFECIKKSYLHKMPQGDQNKLSPGDVTCSMVTVVNNTLLCI